MKYFLLLIVVITHDIYFAQSPSENLDKYWSYRNRLRTDFLKIGNLPGESIPMCIRAIGFAYGGVAVNADGDAPSRIYYQDATIYLGHYLAVLATEIKLLSNSYNLSTNAGEQQALLLQLTASKNELYYALHTVNRLDEWAEKYLSQSSNNPGQTDRNGLLMRDDVPPDFHDNFQNDHSEIFDRDCDFIRTHSNFTPVEMWGNQQHSPGDQIAHDPTNVMSLDQVTSILMGLKTVYTLVPSEVINPTGNDVPINIKEEARTIALRIIHYIINDVDGCTSNCKSFNIRNFDGLFRPAGYDMTFAAPFIVKIALEFGDPDMLILQTLDQIQNMHVAFQMHPQVLLDAFLGMNNPIFGEGDLSCQDNIEDMLQDLVASGEPVTIGSIKMWALFTLIDQIQSQNMDLSVAGNPCLTVNEQILDALNTINIDIEGVGCDNLIEGLVNALLSLISVPSIDNLPVRLIGVLEDNEICLTTIGFFSSQAANGISNVINDDNVHIFLELATVANKWNQSYVNYVGSNSNLDWYGMLHDVLHNNQIPSNSSADILVTNNYLNSAPCKGPWDDPNWMPSAACEDYTAEPTTTSGWRGASRLFHPGLQESGDCGQDFRGEFSGLDYMLYYNLHHLLWPNTLPSYQRSISCQCVEEITYYEELWEPINVNPKFVDYLAKGIPIESYLAHDLTLTSAQGTMEVKNDLIICSPDSNVSTTLTITDHAQLKLYGGNTITVRAGNKLVFEDGAYFMGGISYEPSPGVYVDHQATLIVEAGAEVHVMSGAVFEPYLGMTIRMYDGAKFIVDDATVRMSFISNENHWLLYGEDTELNIRNGSEFVNENQDNFNAGAVDGAKIVVEDSYMDLPISIGIHLGAYSEFHATNSYIHIPGSGLAGHDLSKVFITDSHVELDNGLIKIDGGSELFLNHSTIDVGSEGEIKILRLDGPDLPGKMFTDNSEIYLEGAESKMIFQGGELYIPPGQTFQFHYTDLPHGYIEVLQGCDNLLHTGANSVLKLEGENSDDLVLKVHNGGVLSNANFGQGKISFLTCKVDLTSGTISTNLPVKTMETRFETSTEGFLDVWYGDFRCSYSEFQSVDVSSVLCKYFMDHCEVNNGNFNVFGGGFNFADCNFHATDIESDELQMISNMQKCVFDEGVGSYYYDSEGIYEDNSLVEIKMNECHFIGPNNGDGIGIGKTGGKLSLKCSVFEDLLLGIQVADGAVLNMSTSDFAGYNRFTNCETMIYSDNALAIQIDRGYNDFSDADVYIVDGFIEDYECGTDGEVACAIPEIQANHNVWPHQGTPVESEYLNLRGEDHCTGAGTDCILPFIDDYPESEAVNCGSKIPIIDFTKSAIHPSFSNEVLISKQVTSKNESSDTNQNGWLKDLDINNPIITTSFFDHVELEEALIVAASYLELLDTLGNDSIAIELFYQILTSGLDRSIEEVRWKMQWGVRNMKSGLENMFLQHEITSEMNTQEFHPIVQQYVDVLNTITDNNVSDSTYIERFYFELNKGQLFNTLGNLDMAYEIFDHLDDCQLDSLEQDVLNKWIQNISIGMSVMQQYSDGVSSDSISFAVDTTGFSVPEPYIANEYYFGAVINSPNSVSYVPCGFGYKNMLRQNKNNFTSGVFPNPSNGIINIQYVGQDQFMNLRIIDANGKIMLRNSKFLVNGEIWSLNLTDIPAGDYVVLLNSHNNEEQHRIIFR